MRVRTHARIALLLLVAVFASVTTSASADSSLSASQLFIAPSSFPIAGYPSLTTASDGSLHVGGGGSPVVEFRVCAPAMLRAEDAYVPTRDYRATLRSNGDVDATFTRPGAYMVRVVHGNGSIQDFMVLSRASGYNQCFDGPQNEFACPADPYQYVGTDVSGFPDGFTNRKVVNNLQALVEAVCADYNAALSPIGITIADHGCEGTFTINGVDQVSLAPADAARLALFCTLKGKVCNLTLIACSAAHGAAGHEFICKLSECLGGIEVRGWETDIHVNQNGSNYTWSSNQAVPFIKGEPWNAGPKLPAQPPDKVTWDVWYDAPLAATAPAVAGTTVLYSQNFNVGASCTGGGWTTIDLTFGLYGNYLALFPGVTQVQQDPCAKDLSCVWAAINASTETYACGGFPLQKAVPKGNGFGQYIRNEIWSPTIPLAGVGSAVTLKFSAYRDLEIDGLVFYTWHVRDIVAGVPGLWKDRGLVYYGGQKDWLVHTEPVGDLLRLATATHVQIALGVRDMCGQWCGIYGTGACHSHSPLIDSVRLYRIDTAGPQWSIRDVDQFQDNFASDGTNAGVVRADAALSIRPVLSPGVLPGDSAVVRVEDPINGLAVDPVYGGPAVYIYLAVWPGQPSKSGAALTPDATRWPYIGSTVIAGITWYCIRLDYARLYNTAVLDAYCVDLNDNLFTPGDTICFFYCAQSVGGLRTYAFCSNLTAQSSDINQAAADPAEFTCLPAGGWNHGGDILYVDGMDGRGGQLFFDTAFRQLGIFERVDRYDVRGATSRVGNRLGGRVNNVVGQLVDCYRKIIWDCGDLAITLGDGGTGFIEKTDDFGLLNAFLGNLTSPGGVYLCGDDLPSTLSSSPGASAVAFKSTYLTYTLTTGNHKSLYGLTPLGRGTTGNCFSGDTFIIFGGCPLMNDFDVMTPTGITKMEVSYGAPATNNGAVLSKVTNNGFTNVGVLLSGFSFAYIRDDETDGVLDRADHLHDIITWLGNVISQPTGTNPALRSSLDQNYPNPFNPTTTISFFIKENAEVRLDVYDARGSLVRTLVNERQRMGAHRAIWNGKNNAGQDTASGVYFYRLTAGDFTSTKKMVLLK